MKEKIKKKGKFESMFLDGRPPVNVGVTSSGDVFGGTAVTFSDVLGDQQFNLYAASISQYRTLSLSYLNLERRFNYALQGYSQTQFFYGSGSSVFYDPAYAGIINRDLAIATQTIRGGSAFGIWPFNKYRRVEVSAGILNYNEEFNDPLVQEYSQQYQQDQFGRPLITSGTYVPLGVNYVQETTIFREFGPLAGNTVRARVRGRRRRSPARCRGSAPTSMPATTCASAARACSRCARAASTAGASRPTSCTSAATPRCAATTTCSSSATSRRSSTPNCGSRSSRRC